MSRLLLPALLLCFASLSCEKSKKILSQAGTAIEHKISENTKSPSSETSPELLKLVDQNADGVIFRKDLPFPQRLEIVETKSSELNGRMFQSSAVETQATEIKGTSFEKVKLERDGDEIRYTKVESTFTKPVPAGAKKPDPKAAAKPAQPFEAPATYRFHKTPKGWKSADGNSFRAAALAKSILPVFDELLVETALAPRSLWFGKKRFKKGDEITISSENLAMIMSGKCSGSLTLVFDSVQTIGNHPCGVFSIKGDVNIRQQPDFEGELADSDCTIDSGKIWLSLLYPVILKEEFDTIQSYRTGGQGGLVKRQQGRMKYVLTREWKIK
jgi:hypothetical protein